MFVVEIQKRRVHHHAYSNRRWHLDEVFVKINGETHYLWRAVDHEGEVLESFVTKRRDRRAAMVQLGNEKRQEIGRWLNNRGENFTWLFDEESIQCNAFAERRPFRNLSPYIPQFAITSTTKEISSHEMTLGKNARLSLPNGSDFLLHKSPHRISKLRRVCVRLTAPS